MKNKYKVGIVFLISFFLMSFYIFYFMDALLDFSHDNGLIGVLIFGVVSTFFVTQFIFVPPLYCIYFCNQELKKIKGEQEDENN